MVYTLRSKELGFSNNCCLKTTRFTYSTSRLSTNLTLSNLFFNINNTRGRKQTWDQNMPPMITLTLKYQSHLIILPSSFFLFFPKHHLLLETVKGICVPRLSRTKNADISSNSAKKKRHTHIGRLSGRYDNNKQDSSFEVRDLLSSTHTFCNHL